MSTPAHAQVWSGPWLGVTLVILGLATGCEQKPGSRAGSPGKPDPQRVEKPGRPATTRSDGSVVAPPGRSGG
jgi:hypothetical protein